MNKLSKNSLKKIEEISENVSSMPDDINSTNSKVSRSSGKKKVSETEFKH